MSVEFYSNIKKRRIGPVFIAFYLLVIGGAEYSLRYLVADVPLSLLVMCHETLLISLLFFVFLIIYVVLLPKERFLDAVFTLVSFFWIIVLSPVITFLLMGSARDTLLHVSDDVLGNLMFLGPPNFGVVIVVYLLSGLPAISIFNLQKVSIDQKSKKKTTDLIYKIKAPISFFVGLISGTAVFSIKRVFVYSRGEMQLILYNIYATEPYISSGLESLGTNQYIPLLKNQSYHLSIVLLLMENLILVLLLFYLYDKKKFISFFKNIKLFRTLHFVVVVLIGVLVVKKIAPNHALHLIELKHLPFAFMAVSCLILLWQFTAMLNDLYDVKIDRLSHPDRPLISESIGVKFYTDLCFVLPMVSSLLSLLLGFRLFLLNLGAITLAIVYSVPPFRLRDRLYGHLCVGLGSVIAFLFGIYSPVYWRFGIGITGKTIMREIPIYPEVLKISLIILAVLSISPLINAVGDYSGDKKHGVKNLYTVLGYRKGKRLVSVFIFLMFLSPLLIIYKPLDFVILVPVSALSSYLFYRCAEYRVIFMIYFGILVYSLLRYISFL